MSFEGVKEIKHTRDSRMVNALIAAGWVLIGMTPGTTEEGHPWPLYTMGWKQDGTPAQVKQDW
ncbi:hypothetical protein VNPA120661_69070 [Pseudomonas aeruginosa]|uniref:hypothetical protein n=1 Tax=Pseudomonas aeruginosa TaxID=287 RepID=UPI001D0A2702|nr:hypothetical protein [Pseudomonas aeruginosa]EKW1994460.1 hypothetical protein [Pseudomonas aeruginosa]ELH7340091.1 hypothetical protein [Pseudomonas aeruginosa]ELQ2725726.1 hypothetical protein [Pseudomonas aeruginosa]ELQ2759914.1 hypothetical protein [Pseudomonas aeruginosa]MBN0415193.1 hypothetical protein [Pseudomonas aeruginosa]